MVIWRLVLPSFRVKILSTICKLIQSSWDAILKKQK
uniref:Uncharacterized protein n=1 Tax=Arundo donax TaxID=35708 RepID=A0A0A9FZ94_ARUDO